MKLGITRWKMVPSERGAPCLVAPLAGFFQSLVPVANPMKLATVSGVSFSNSVQRILPAVVSKTATGSADEAVLGAALETLLVPACDHTAREMNRNESVARTFPIQSLLRYSPWPRISTDEHGSRCPG